MSTSSRNQAARSAIFPHKYLNKHSYRVHALYLGILTIRLVQDQALEIVRFSSNKAKFSSSKVVTKY